MNWNDVGPRWKQAKSKIQSKWGKLTDDDLDLIDGRRDRLEGKIQRRYGFAPDHVRRKWMIGLAGSPQRDCDAARSSLPLAP